MVYGCHGARPQITYFVLLNEKTFVHSLKKNVSYAYNIYSTTHPIEHLISAHPWCRGVTNIQYACQRHYFGALAETYFDNKDRDAVSNVQRKSKTIEAFHRLPDEFTIEDIMRCFGVNVKTARVRASRLAKDRLIEKLEDYKENGLPMSFHVSPLTLRCHLPHSLWLKDSSSSNIS